ncbi:MAG: hypothetical protein LBL82_05580 [Oscillospiraceae bacterium]|jgi:phenylpyruvate tautomerase PptA (4-oxalocrotonate tautomerase family)|nr:hypothetical protein [Oscillospiraceae bacterium]
MPYVEIKTNRFVREECADEIKSEIASAIAIFPGKSEQWLMVSVLSDIKLYFAGSDAPAAVAEVMLFGTPDKQKAEQVTAKITSILAEKLKVEASRIYVKYEGCAIWGWNGSNL